MLTYALIPIIGVYGAVIGTCAAELFGLVFQMVISRKFVSVSILLKKMIPFSIMGIIMYCAIKVVSYIYNDGIFALLLQIGVGAIVYCALTMIYLLLFEREVGNEIINMFSKTKK